jgi:prepilin-type N-terminal cleavage/methylation domain-containing protein
MRGFTLVELLLVVVVVGILTALAAPRMGIFVEQLQVSAALDAVYSDLHYAKMLAVRSGHRVRVQFDARPDLPACRSRIYRIIIEEESPTLARIRDLGEIADRGCLSTGALSMARFDRRGFPVGVTNQTIALVTAHASGSVVLSRFGRIRRTY